MKFSVPKQACEQLRHLFYSRCAVTIKAELSVESWVDWLCGAGYSSPEVAKTLFLAKMSSLKSVWRFVDFAEFCMIFGAGSMVLILILISILILILILILLPLLGGQG